MNIPLDLDLENMNVKNLVGVNPTVDCPVHEASICTTVSSLYALAELAITRDNEKIIATNKQTNTSTQNNKM